MDKLRIRGGTSLNGQIPISGAKNAALPLMAATLLTGEPVHLGNLPDLADIRFMMQMLEQHGTTVKPPRDGGADWPGRFTFHAPLVTSTEAPYDLVRKMRASVLVLGPLLGREGRATVSLPGGCAIGNRPVDLHIKGLSEIGGELELVNGNIEARAPGGRLTGGKVMFPVVSVGATENVMTAATLAKGETVMVNAAREPEIVDLANFLNAMGAKIEGQGTDTIHIQGVDALHGAEYATVADRIEAGTYAIAVAITGGDVELVGASTDTIESVVDTLKAAGVEVEETQAGLRIKRNGHQVKGVDVMTEPYPGFPTDLQAQMMVLMATAEGASMITETIFENRFQHVPELGRMGANINVHHASAMVRGVERLTGAPVMATDLRASVSLVLAGLAADGVTEVNRVYHLDRGYERLVEKLSACGADIERVSGEDADDLGAAVTAAEVA